jgi:hypothetical protein
MATLQARITAALQAIGADIKALTTAVGAVGGNSVMGQFPGPVVVQVGTVRYYPRVAITLTNIKAWLSANALTNVVAVVRKNGVAAQTITINAGSLTTLASSTISLLTTDYLTIDITGGSGNDLVLRLDF